ncbi:MAG: branched-chain amino acid ABC transporter permease [Candidatus Promineifilaceae bacterium]|nr:branched-chain amino acid ABC transporter permease [Candidatus Promineifilaceae bacterium]
MEDFLLRLPQTLINGLTLGSVYALIALGYSMVYGVLKLLNFAHGDVYMVGAYVGLAVMTVLIPAAGAFLPIPLLIIVMLLVAMVVTGVLGIMIERFAYRPLRNAPRIAPLISALGVSFVLQNFIQLTVSPRPLSYGSGTLIPTGSALMVGDLRLQTSRLLVIGTTVLLMVVLAYFVRSTRLGRAMRAVSQDPEAAEMMGVNVDFVIAATFFIGSALAGVGGVLVGIVFFSVRHTMGFIAGLKGFTASVVGGIGSIPGALLGGYLIGMAEAFASVYISVTFKDAITFLILLLVLLFRPTGLLGKPISRKV